MTSFAVEPDACGPTRSLAELQRCADDAFRAADSALNRNYAALMKTLPSERRAEERDKQRHWLEGRDKYCASDADAMASRDHPLYPVLYQNCRAESTAARAEGFLHVDGDGEYCEPLGYQAQLTLCAHEDFERADRELNRIYRRLLAQQADAARHEVKREQRRWLSRRDPACRDETRDSEGGSIWPMEYAGCRASSTRARVRDLILKLND